MFKAYGILFHQHNHFYHPNPGTVDNALNFNILTQSEVDPESLR